MQLSGILLAIVASLSIAIEASPVPVHQNETDDPSAQDGGFDPVSRPPKTISARSDDSSFSMSGVHERDFDPVSPPRKGASPDPADKRDAAKGILERGFDPVSPPPKVIPPRSRSTNLRQ